MINIIVLLKEGVVVTSQRLVVRDKTRGCCYEPEARITGQDAGGVVTSQRLVLRDKTGAALDGWGWNGS